VRNTCRHLRRGQILTTTSVYENDELEPRPNPETLTVTPLTMTKVLTTIKNEVKFQS